ncbi:multisubunit sodium/proton antiporter, MrpE subunit [Desulfocicer vacuolatum DSM 3385]|uniref:Multisubunit sodium/proton antiporter, MrpE subunit n=1 Tax=Desulfocicer vacuolatum DSM 3385 TaxID=1121400 RepID=A0A1W1Z0X8_9BACT|nr:Na+/H+ antiporter subunit E [Desulfocicer vacuolatum]SMC41972.1 multisubunit sodium/proton antiporter, MrpE subunit [Desulfocicer vacuolatum DSM 3385]
MKKTRRKSIVFTNFLILFFFWMIFSGKFDAFHLTLGVLSCSLVAWMAADFLITAPSFATIAKQWIGFSKYIPWLLWQIVLANIHVLRLVLSRDMNSRINPQIIKFRSTIKSQMGLVTFANSITLTPGTITVAATTYGDMAIHAIDNESAAPLPGDMEKRIAKIFGE